MRKIIQWIGSVVFAAFMYCVPVLVTLSFALNWQDHWKFLYFVIGVCQFILLVGLVLMRVEDKK